MLEFLTILLIGDHEGFKLLTAPTRSNRVDLGDLRRCYCYVDGLESNKLLQDIARRMALAKLS